MNAEREEKCRKDGRNAANFQNQHNYYYAFICDCLYIQSYQLMLHSERDFISFFISLTCEQKKFELMQKLFVIFVEASLCMWHNYSAIA